MATVKARKGDFVAWADPMTVTTIGEGVKTHPRWRLGIVDRATREGVVVAAVELGTRHAVKIEHKDRRVSNAKTIDLEGLTVDYLGRQEQGSYNPPKTLDEARELVRPYLIGAEVAR